MFEGGCMDDDPLLKEIGDAERCREPGCPYRGAYTPGQFCFVHQQVCRCGHGVLAHAEGGPCAGAFGNACSCTKYERDCDYRARRRRIDDAAEETLAALRAATPWLFDLARLFQQDRTRDRGGHAGTIWTLATRAQRLIDRIDGPLPDTAPGK